MPVANASREQSYNGIYGNGSVRDVINDLLQALLHMLWSKACMHVLC